MLPQRILVVDDEHDVRTVIALGLQDRGFSVATASSGPEALRIISEQKPELVILDLMMPEMSGEDVCQAIKLGPDGREIIVVILSARSDLQTKVKCLQMGAEEYLVKPIDAEELAARLARLLQMRKQWNSDYSSQPDTSPESSPVREKTVPTLQAAKFPSESGPAPASPVKKQKYGTYRIETLAGSGSMGVVYKAHDEVLNRYVALKVLPTEWSSYPESVEHFHKEAKAIAAINHPGIAQIYTFGEEEGESYFALQWCPGGSVSDLLQREGRIGLLSAIDIILQCSQALLAASKKGVVHRDIKPSNMMFDENHQIRIVDFGVAHVETGLVDSSSSGWIVGSPAYMSPEQTRGDRTDHRTDMYSLGMTFYRMLYGRVPFPADSVEEAARKHATESFPAYNDLGGKIPLRAHQIIEKMTQKNPNARYPMYLDLIEDLEKLRTELYSHSELKVPCVVMNSPEPPIKSRNFFDLLSDIYRHEYMGILKVSWGPVQKRFMIQRNEFILFESPQPNEDFWSALLKKNLIRKEDKPSADADFEEAINRFLFLQVIALEDLKLVYRELMKSSILQVFYWPQCEGEFVQAELENDAFCRIPLDTVLLEGARHYIPYEVLKEDVPVDQYIVRALRFDAILASLNLPRTDIFLASRLEGDKMTLDTLQLMTGFPVEQITRFVHALRGLGAVTYISRAERPIRSRPAVLLTPDPPVRVVLEQAVARSVEAVQVKPPAQERKQRQHPLMLHPTPNQPSNAEEFQAAEKLYQTALQKYERGDFWGAGRLCAHAIRKKSSEAKYHHLMALTLAPYPHSVSVAEESFSKAIELDPWNVEFCIDLALFLKNRGEIDAAILQCKKALEVSPNHIAARKLLQEMLHPL